MTEAVPALRPEPPTAYRWVVLVVISLAMFANYYVYDSIAPIADILKSDLGFTDADFGALYSVYSIAAVIVLLIGGVIIDRFGTARSTILFAAICTVAGILTAVSSDLTVMLAARFLLGVGFAISGYCPGTSVVAMASRKLDGLFTIVGVAA